VATDSACTLSCAPSNTPSGTGSCRTLRSCMRNTTRRPHSRRGSAGVCAKARRQPAERIFFKVCEKEKNNKLYTYTLSTPTLSTHTLNTCTKQTHYPSLHANANKQSPQTKNRHPTQTNKYLQGRIRVGTRTPSALLVVGGAPVRSPVEHAGRWGDKKRHGAPRVPPDLLHPPNPPFRETIGDKPLESITIMELS